MTANKGGTALMTPFGDIEVTRGLLYCKNVTLALDKYKKEYQI